MSHFKDGRKLIWGILLFTQPCNCLKSQNEGITWIIQNATFLLNPRTIRYLNLIFLHTTLSLPIWKEFNFLYFLCNTHPWTYFLRSKIESMTVRYAQIVDKAFTETDHQCNAWIFTFRKLQKCSLLCILLWSHWNVACCYRTSCTVSTMLPAIPGQEWTLHGHSTYLTDCIELGHSGAMHPANVKHSTDTMQGPQIQVLSKLKDIQEIY